MKTFTLEIPQADGSMRLLESPRPFTAEDIQQLESAGVFKPRFESLADEFEATQRPLPGPYQPPQSDVAMPESLQGDPRGQQEYIKRNLEQVTAKPSYGMSVARTIPGVIQHGAEGFTLGSADELLGALAGPDARELYNVRKEEYRGKNPGTAMVADIAGSVAGLATAGKMIPGATAALQKSLLARTGAAGGVAASNQVGRGEGSLDDRIGWDTGWAAAEGAVFQLGGEAVAAAWKSFLWPAVKHLGSWGATPFRRAASKRDSVLRDQLKAGQVASKVDDVRAGYSGASVSTEPAVIELVKEVGEEAATKITRNMEAHVAKLGSFVRGELTSTFGAKGEGGKIRNYLQTQAKALETNLYTQAKDIKVNNADPALEAAWHGIRIDPASLKVAKDLALSKAQKYVQDMAKQGTVVRVDPKKVMKGIKPPSTVGEWHELLKAVNEQAGKKALKKGAYTIGKTQKAMRDDSIEALSKQSPVFAKALALTRVNKQSMEMLDLGRDLVMKMSPEKVAEAFTDYTTRYLAKAGPKDLKHLNETLLAGIKDGLEQFAEDSATRAAKIAASSQPEVAAALTSRGPKIMQSLRRILPAQADKFSKVLDEIHVIDAGLVSLAKGLHSQSGVMGSKALKSNLAGGGPFAIVKNAILRPSQQAIDDAQIVMSSTTPESRNILLKLLAEDDSLPQVYIRELVKNWRLGSPAIAGAFAANKVLGEAEYSREYPQ